MAQIDLESMVRRYGYASASCQTPRGGYDVWWNPDGSACIPYVDTGSAWVAAGEPLCPEGERHQLADQFWHAAQRARRRVAFFGVERPWPVGADWSQHALGLQPILDPALWLQILRKTRSLREQLRRARAHGVLVTQTAHLAPWLPSLEALIASWRASKAMPPMGFLVKLPDSLLHESQRLYVATVGEICVGFAITVKMNIRQGCLLEHLLRAPAAPNGTTESLVHAILQDAIAEEDKLVTLGLAPLAGNIGPVLSWFRRRGKALYDFSGLEHFKAKFRPQRWDPVTLYYPREQSVIVSIYDCLCAFAGSGLLRYAIRTTLRGPKIVLRGLALMLIPWVLTLALCDAEHWFASERQRWCWVAFDMGVAGSLWALSRRFVGKRASLLSWLVLFDALTTLGLALLYNAPRVQGPTEAGILATAVAAPWLAWAVLRGAIVRAVG